MNHSHGRPSLPLQTGLLTFVLGTAGCVLPGGLRPVGGHHVSGQLTDDAGRALPNQKLVLVQGHFDRLDSKSVGHVLTASDEEQLQRVEVTTDQDGRFAHDFHRFTHCHPVWIIPPLGTLPSKLNGEAGHGSFFIVQTPGAAGQIYEIRTDGRQARISVYDTKRRRAKRWKTGGDHSEHVAATVRSIPTDYGHGPSWPIQEVDLKFTRAP